MMNEQQIIETLATKVMEWRIQELFHSNAKFIWKSEDEFIPLEFWNPLQNIADAWQVADKLVLERGLPIEVQSSIREYRVSFNGEVWKYGNTVQEAICRAALLMI